MVGSTIVSMAYRPPPCHRSGAALEVLTLELNFISQPLGPSYPWCLMGTQQGHEPPVITSQFRGPYAGVFDIQGMGLELQK